MTTPSPMLITIGQDVFEVSPGFLETLDEIGFVINSRSRAQTLQQALALMYLLARERRERQVQTFMHYPDGGMRMVQFWQTASRPKLHAVGSTPSPTVPEPKPYLDPGLEKFRTPMPEFQEQRRAQESKAFTPPKQGAANDAAYH